MVKFGLAVEKDPTRCDPPARAPPIHPRHQGCWSSPDLVAPSAQFPGHADPTDRRGFPIDATGEKRTRTTLAVFAVIPGRKVETTKKPRSRENLGTVQTIPAACIGALTQLAEISSISVLSLFRIRDSGQSIACPRTRHNLQTSLSRPTRPRRMVEFPPAETTNRGNMAAKRSTPPPSAIQAPRHSTRHPQGTNLFIPKSLLFRDIILYFCSKRKCCL